MTDDIAPHPPAYGQSQPFEPQHYQPQSTNGLAVASMVLGIMWFYGVGAVLALVFGYRARRQIDRSQGAESGRGMATAGIVLGWVGVAGAVLVTALVIATAASVDSELERLEDAGDIAPAEPADPVPATDDDLTDTFGADLPAPEDFTLDVVVTSKQCFGSAGCSVVYDIDASWPAYADGDYDVIYEVRGGEDGPVIDTLEVTGDEYSYLPGFVGTASEGAELTAVATQVRP